MGKIGKKGQLLLLLTFFICLQFPSCATNGGGDANQKIPVESLLSSSGYSPKGSMMKQLPNVENKPLSELTAYSFDSFRFPMRSRNFTGFRIDATSSEIHSLEVFHASFPVEYIKKIDKEHLYTVSKLEKDDVQFYVYCVFNRETKKLTKKDGVPKNGTYETWETTGEYYFVNRKLSHADFERINVGDSLESVLSLDPMFEVTWDLHSFRPVTETVLLLADGIELIETQNPTDGADLFTVSKKTFLPFGSNPRVPLGIAPEQTATYHLLQLNDLELP